MNENLAEYVRELLDTSASTGQPAPKTGLDGVPVQGAHIAYRKRIADASAAVAFLRSEGSHGPARRLAREYTEDLLADAPANSEPEPEPLPTDPAELAARVRRW